MTEAKSDGTSRRALRRAFRIYIGLCTLLVTVYLILFLWSILSGKASSGNGETMILASYGEYVAKEYPKRADYFSRLAGTLNVHCRKVSVRAADVLKYLGKPDLIEGTEDIGTVVYLYEHPGVTNKWALYAFLKEGKLAGMGLNDATVNDHSGYRPYATQ